MASFPLAASVLTTLPSPAPKGMSEFSMIIDTHTHVWSFPSYGDLSPYIKTAADLIALRTRHPELYNLSLTESPIDNSDDLIGDMDKNDVAFALTGGGVLPDLNDLYFFASVNITSNV